MRKNDLHKFGVGGICMFCKLTIGDLAGTDDPEICTGVEDKSKMVQTEETLQQRCETCALETGWVKPGSQVAEKRQNIKGIFFHIPNQAFGGSRSSSVVALWLKNLPDLIFLHPDGRYMGFELKSRSGKSNKGQRALARHLNVIECKTFEYFVEKLEAWYEMQEPQLRK